MEMTLSWGPAKLEQSTNLSTKASSFIMVSDDGDNCEVLYL